MPIRRRTPTPLDARALEERALSYLNRFDCSVDKLRSHLRSLIRRQGGDAALTEHVEVLLVRYQESKLLDDSRFAKQLAERLSGRGASRLLVVQKLRARGIARSVAEEIVPRSSASELEAARALARRKRLGPHRPLEEREPNRRRDLAALARAGFSYETAARALGYGSNEDF